MYFTTSTLDEDNIIKQPPSPHQEVAVLSGLQ